MSAATVGIGKAAPIAQNALINASPEPLVWPIVTRIFGRCERRAARGRLSAFSTEAGMATGNTVKFFNSQKGFGFIQPQDGGKDVFVHISAVERAGMSTLNEGQKVSYDVVSERGKLAAANLQAV
jgi:cold shock protein